MIAPIIQFVVGFVALVGGAEFLIRGASRVAARYHVPTVIIGLTVVAFGTSLPELTVSIIANLDGGNGGIAIGNIIGSNIANFALILGVCGLISTLVIDHSLMRLEFPLLLVTTLTFFAVTRDGVFGRLEASIFVAVLLLYVAWHIRQVLHRRPMQRRATAQVEAVEVIDAAVAQPSTQLWFDLMLIVMGMVALVAGANWLVKAARTLALAIGVSETVIGLTLVAVGTSLPEMATTLVAVFRGHNDLAVGNVVGSNIFNLLAIAGISGLVKPLAIPLDISWVDWSVLLGLTFLVYLFVIRHPHRLVRYQALLLLLAYVGYSTYLFLR